jgi:hypothetical protein
LKILQYLRNKLFGGIEKSEAYQRLSKICRGGEKQMDRLINYEIKRSPSLSKEKAIEMAIQRYIRDQ